MKKVNKIHCFFNKFFIAFVLLSVHNSSFANSSDTLIYPNNNDIIFSPGGTYPIIWNACTLSDTADFEIWVHDYKRTFTNQFILGETKNTGLYFLKFPAIFWSTDSLFFSIREKGSQVEILSAVFPVKINSNYNEIYINDEDSVRINNNDTLAIYNKTSDFYQRLSEIKFTPQPVDFNSRFAAIKDRNPLSSDNCYYFNVNFHANFDFYILRKGNYFLKMTGNLTTGIISRFSEKSYSCPDLLESNTEVIRENGNYRGIRVLSTGARFNLEPEKQVIVRVSHLSSENLVLHNISVYHSSNLTKEAGIYRKVLNYNNLDKKILLIDSTGLIVGISNYFNLSTLSKGIFRFVSIASEYEHDLSVLIGNSIKRVFQFLPNGVIIGSNFSVLRKENPCQNFSIGNIDSGFSSFNFSNEVNYNGRIRGISAFFIKSEKALTFNPGFQVLGNSVFKAEIGNCN